MRHNKPWHCAHQAQPTLQDCAGIAQLTAAPDSARSTVRLTRQRQRQPLPTHMLPKLLGDLLGELLVADTASAAVAGTLPLL